VWRTTGGPQNRDPVATLAASVKLSPRTFTLREGAFLQTTARLRGPQYWDLRPVVGCDSVDLSAHLVEQRAAPARANGSSQIDALAAPPPAPPWRAQKCGVDAGSQVPHGSRAPAGGGGGGGSRRSAAARAADAPLFDFDAAVAPLVRRLARDVLAQALVELQNEADLLALARRRGAVQGALDADARAAEAVVARARAANAARDAALAAARAHAAAQARALARVSACAMAGGAVRGAFAAARAGVWRAGGFVDAAAAHARLVTVPAAFAAAAAASGPLRPTAEALVDGVVGEALARVAAEGLRRAAARKRAEEALLRYNVRVLVRLPRTQADVDGEAHLHKNFTLPGEDLVDVMDEEVFNPHGSTEEAGQSAFFRTVMVGPLSVLRFDSVGNVEGAIAEWMGRVNSRHVRRIAAMADGAALALFSHGKRLPQGEELLGPNMERLRGLELRPWRPCGSCEGTPHEHEVAQWRLDVREEPLPSREELGLPPKDDLSHADEEEEGGEEEEEEGGGLGDEEDREEEEEGGEEFGGEGEEGEE
jgi:hypothetical protein